MNESDVCLPVQTWGSLPERKNGYIFKAVDFRSPDTTEETDMTDTGFHVAEILEDLRLAENVDRTLQATGHLALRGIQVSVSDRAVVLRGCVPSYHLKQIAELTVLGVLGVEELKNELEVVPCEMGNQAYPNRLWKTSNSVVQRHWNGYWS